MIASDLVKPVTSESDHRAIDALTVEIATQLKPVDCPVVDHFAPGVYVREFHSSAGTTIVSKIHKTEHLFIISKGRARVWIGGKTVELAAPYHGRTMPGTRRVLYVLEDLVWTTIHPTKLTTVEEIEAEIIEPRDEHLLGLSSPITLPELGA